VPTRVAPGTADTISDHADGFVVHVTGASDVDAAVRALERARADIAELAAAPDGDPDGAVLSHVVLAPDGPLLRIGRLEADDDAVRHVPDLVANRLDEAGIEGAVVRSPRPGGALDKLDSCPNAVVLRLFPLPAGQAGVLPPEWIDIACEWVLADLAPSDAVPLRLLGVGFEVRVADAPSVVHHASLAKAWCDVVNGDLDDRVRTASITFGRTPHVALAAGGPGCDSQALLARFDLLCEVARELAGDIAYACVDIETTFEGVGLGLPTTGWRGRGGASPNLVAGELADLLVPDAFPYQILSSGHLRRLGEADPALMSGDAPIGEEIGDGRIEVLVGDPSDWLPVYAARDEIQAEGWEVLAPLLATDAQVEDLLRERRGQPGAGPAGGVAPSATVATPDLDDITLETLPHGRRGLRLTFLELVSWLAHEHHSDAPECVSPVLATYSRWFASALDDRRRQELKNRARRMIGTGRTERAATAISAGTMTAADVDRAWLAVDWLIRVQATAWLRLAGLTEAAGRIESIGPATDRGDLLQAVDVLGSAISIAGRRLDLTASIAGTERPGDAAIVEQSAWDAWERASEAAGWVAASEAAGIGVPAELAYATDLRVIECAREARVRDDLEATHRSIGDTAWATALHAMADEAWTAGWAAAHPAVDNLAVLPLATALDRAARAASNRAAVDDDEREQSVELAEAAAKELLTGAALEKGSWRSELHPWDAAFRAAARAQGGELWSRIQDLARAAVDEGPWEAGMAAARAAVDDVLREAPDLVARAVGAAVAREAAGAAARGVALRAAAVALAEGASSAAAAEAAEAALAPTVAELQDAALALLDRMIATPAAPAAP